MKNNIFLLLFLFFGIFIHASEDPNLVIKQMYTEMNTRVELYQTKKSAIEKQLSLIQTNLRTEDVLEKKVSLLVEKDLLQDENELLKRDLTTDVSKIRYVKGLEIIKILYEKTLALDHHFASVRTFSEISKMSNPNQYPEFAKVNDIIKQKRERKAGIDLTALLGANPIANVVSTFSNMLISTLSKEEKDDELAKIECILDFTLRMQTYKK